MSSADNEDSVSICANCGKEGSDVTNICNKCKMVKYCNAACKKKHRHKHKNQCERWVAELHDIELFKRPPQLYGDCPICFLRIPTLDSGRRYQTCCGKMICSGCSFAPVYDNQGNKVDDDKQNQCPFCRVVAPRSDKEMNNMLCKRSEANDAIAIFHQGNHYRDGRNGFPQDHTKALELWHRAAELGYATAYFNIGALYHFSGGVEVDKEKTIHYWELAAMGGNTMARCNLGFAENIKALYALSEEGTGNFDRASKHYMIAVRSGCAKSLEKIRELYSKGHVTKEDYTEALRSYQGYLGEIKSVQRDEAATYSEEYKYIE